MTYLALLALLPLLKYVFCTEHCTILPSKQVASEMKDLYLRAWRAATSQSRFTLKGKRVKDSK